MQDQSPKEKKVYTPMKVSLLGNISELTQNLGFSGPMAGGMMGMMGMMGGMGGMMMMMW